MTARQPLQAGVSSFSHLTQLSRKIRNELVARRRRPPRVVDVCRQQLNNGILLTFRAAQFATTDRRRRTASAQTAVHVGGRQTANKSTLSHHGKTLTVASAF